MPVEGVPQLPEVIFWSGDKARLVRDLPIIRDGVEYRRLYLILTEALIWRYGITEAELNYSITEYGCFTKEYPAEHMHTLSNTPENQIILITCNFDGTSAFKDDFTNIRNELVKKGQTIRSLESENSTLRSQLKSMIERLRTLQVKTLG